MFGRINRTMNTTDPLLNTMYESGIHMIKCLLKGDAIERKYHKDLFVIFHQPPMQKYVNREYLPTILESFLEVWVSMMFGWDDPDKYPNGLMGEAPLLIPSAVILKNYVPSKATTLHNDYGVVINLYPKVFGNFTLGQLVNNVHEFFALFDMSMHTLDALVGVYAAFCLDHDKYVMTNSQPRQGFSIADVCFDLVTGSSFVFPDSAGLIRVYDRHIFFEVTKKQIAAGRLRMVEDCELFGELLMKSGADQDIVNYFIKPISLISAAEAYAYRNSEFSGFLEDRFLTGTAAIDEETEEQDTDSVPGVDSEEPLESGDDTGISEEPTSAEDDKPQIDPKKMLLEMVKPSETMSDFIYREMVARRISAILKNPPENAMPNDLLMLRRWRSRWIYLASVSCLRDFLTRVSIRLSDA
jgi:hypothetical protein